jgi:hypothetical protein
MAKTAATSIEEIDQIRREMARIRTDLHFGVQQTVEGVRSLTDFTSYIRNAPWLSIGLAVAVGFILVPGRKRSEGREPEIRYLASNEEGRPRRRKGLVRTALGLVAPLAIRGAQHYAMERLETFLANQGVPPRPDGEENRSRTAASASRSTEPRSSGRVG